MAAEADTMLTQHSKNKKIIQRHKIFIFDSKMNAEHLHTFLSSIWWAIML